MFSLATIIENIAKSRYDSAIRRSISQSRFPSPNLSSSIRLTQHILANENMYSKRNFNEAMLSLFAAELQQAFSDDLAQMLLRRIKTYFTSDGYGEN